MPEARYSYDQACETLAEHFLAADGWGPLPANAEKDLAQAIQDAVESWFAANS